jgi:lysozyme
MNNMQFTNKGIIGFDVSFYQDDNSTPQGIDFVKMRNYGTSFVIVKCGQNYYPDSDFRTNWENAKNAGIPRASYWFCDDSDTGVNQAAKYVQFLREMGDMGEMSFADFETGSWTDWRQLRFFIEEFQQRTGLSYDKIGVYTGWYWNEHRPYSLTDLMWFSKYPLWLAWYTGDVTSVRLPIGWSECLIWQDGTPSIGKQVGVESLEVDHNIFNGDAVKFRKYFGADPVSVPQTGEKMYDCIVKSTTVPYANLRATPNGADIGDMLPGTAFVADRIEPDSLSREWLHSITPGKEGYVAAWLCDFTERPASQTALPTILVTLKAEGYPTVEYEWKPNV